MGLLWNLDRRAEVGHHLVRVETAHIVAWRRPLAHHDLGNRFVAIDGADIDIVIEWIAPERIPAAPPPTAVEPPRRPPETVRAGAEGTIDISPRLSIGVAIEEDEVIASLLAGQLGSAEQQKAPARPAPSERSTRERQH